MTSLTFTPGETVIAYAGPHYGCAHRVVDVVGRCLLLADVATGDEIRLPMHDVDKVERVSKPSRSPSLTAQQRTDLVQQIERAQARLKLRVEIGHWAAACEAAQEIAKLAAAINCMERESQ